MASLFYPFAISLQQSPQTLCFSPLKPTLQTEIPLFAGAFRAKQPPGKCRASFFGDISDHLIDSLDGPLRVDQLPVLQSGYVQFQRFSGELSDFQKWGFVVFAGIIWVYLTARPGVLFGAIDTYLLAPLQLGFDSLLGRRSLKSSDFVIGGKLGEGSFGVVYSGAFLRKNVKVEERTSRGLELDGKEKVILKKVTLNALVLDGCFKLL